MIQRGINIKLKNRKGQSPLHLSIEKRHDTFTKWMIEFTDIDPYEPDNLGKSPMEVALVSAPLFQEQLEGIKITFVKRGKNIIELAFVRYNQTNQTCSKERTRKNKTSTNQNQKKKKKS